MLISLIGFLRILEIIKLLLFTVHSHDLRIFQDALSGVIINKLLSKLMEDQTKEVI